MSTSTTPTGHTTDSESDWYADYVYDSNGNLRQLRRNAHGTTNAMDNLFYFYKAHNNQLTHVTDQEGVTFATDLPDQSPDNYAYDLDGNLISDASEEIEAIHWNASGKVTRVERTSVSTKHDLMFLYDALGNRYGKVSSVGDAPISEADITMYIRDAQGNPLEIYDYSFDDLGDNEYRESLKLNERILYGSSRIATETDISEEVAYAEFSVDSEEYPFEGNPFEKLSISTTFVDPDPRYASLIIGRKHFELTNHLGNVLATVSDNRFPIDGKYSWVLGAPGTGDYNYDIASGTFVYDAGNGNYVQDEAPDDDIDFYMPRVTMANRYFAYGMIQPNPDNLSGSTRFGFNGMEKDDEVKGNGNSYTTLYRQNDPRLGRWLSVDPKADVMPWQSPYVSMDNNPALRTDPKGDCPICPELLRRAGAGLVAAGVETSVQFGIAMTEDGATWTSAIKKTGCV